MHLEVLGVGVNRIFSARIVNSHTGLEQGLLGPHGRRQMITEKRKSVPGEEVQRTSGWTSAMEGRERRLRGAD